MSKIGTKIKARRKELGITQLELAQRLGYKDKSTIAKIENGTNDITQTRVVEFAKALDVTPAYLMGWTDPEPEPYYLDPEAAQIAQEIFEKPELRVLFDAAKDVKSEDLRIVQGMIDALRRKEQGE